MTNQRDYSMQELTLLSGFSQRTIHYYIQEGLLMGMGKQGPKTRYPQRFLDQLLFIRRLKGEATMTLNEIADVLARLPEDVISAVASGEEPLQVMALRGDESSPDAEPGRQPDARKKAPPLAGLLSKLREVVGEEPPPRTCHSETWHTIQVTPDLFISGRRLRGDQLAVLERAADYLRLLIEEQD